MLRINKLILAVLLAPFILACDPITQDPLVSSPDATLTGSVSVSAQVATSETVVYTFDILDNNTIYEINVRRVDGSNPNVVVCEDAFCTSTVGFRFPNVDNIYDGTVEWYSPSATSPSPLYIYVGDDEGEESKYSITTSVATTSTAGAVLTTVDTYGIVNTNESAESAAFTLAVTDPLNYEIDLNIDVGDISDLTLRICNELECTGTTNDTFTAIDPVDNQIIGAYTADYTGTLYVFIESSSNAIFHIQGYEKL